MFLLLTYWIITGIAAEDVPEVHYQLENSSVCLHAKIAPPHYEPQWHLAGTFVVSNIRMNPAFKDKVDYVSANSSLCIKNLTETDIGIYDLSFTNSAYSSVHEKHRIIVQGHVPRPVIAMSELDANTSAGMCNISVNCSIQSDWLRSFCDADACRTAQTSMNEANISISISIGISIGITGNRTVVCSGNNRVSTKKVTRRMPATCRSQSKEPEPKDPKIQLLLILLLIAVCLFLLVFITFVAKKLLSIKHDQTFSTHLIQNQQVEAPTQPEPRVSTSSSIAYENVGAIHPTLDQAVNTVYSVLQPTKGKPPQGTSDNSKDRTGPQETQAASASQAEQPVQVDTVYSMLQKPRHKQ